MSNLVNDGKPVCWQKVGNNLIIYGKKNTTFPWHLLIGPDWICMLITYSLITIPSFLYLKSIASYSGRFMFLIAVVLTVSTFL